MLEPGGNYFLPIDSAADIGASSYFLKLDDTNILFDCGARSHKESEESSYYPEYNILLEEQLDDFSQLDAICISHAHYDHIGSLLTIASMAPRTPIYATTITKELIRLLLVKLRKGVNFREHPKIQARKLSMLEDIINRIVEVGVKEDIHVKNTTIRFYNAGHMAGASMIGVAGTTQNVLYTGDFSFGSVMDMNAMDIGGFRPDVLIMTATHGYEDRCANKFNYKELEKRINNYLKRGKSVVVYSKSIPKQLDVLYGFKMMKKPIIHYIDTKAYDVIDELSNLSYSVYTEFTRFSKPPQNEPHVLISNDKKDGYVPIKIDASYSLHASMDELAHMIQMCMPKVVYAVHTNVKEGTYNFMDEIENNGRYHNEIIQCENKKTYKIN